MCKWGDTVDLLVPIPASCSYTGKFRWDTKPIDRCLVLYVRALNNAGLYTGGSCCGHGKNKGSISFHDGTVFEIDRVDPESMPCVKKQEANNALHEL